MTLGVNFESVLAAAQAGATWAWATLYGEIAGPVAGFFAARGVSDPQSATGDVFIELSRNLDDFRGSEEDFQVFVFAMVHRRLLVEERDPRRGVRSALADRVLDRLHNDLEIELDLRQAEIPESVKSAFRALAPDQRDVLSLRVVAGLNLEQTARVVGRSIEAVRSIQRKGLSRARHALPGLTGPDAAVAT